jgi:hypothetical protein
MPQTPLATLGPVNYAHIVNAGTVLVKAAPGSLLTMNVNSIGGASSVTLFDVNQTGTLGTVEIAALALATTEAIPTKLDFGPPAAGLAFKNGLAIVSTGTCDLTFGFR